MNPILILLTALGYKDQGPVNDLRKKPTREDYIKNIDCFVKQYPGFCLAIFFTIILIVFISVCFAVVGASAVESGTVYNHLGDFI